jgi:hypothetical protein
MIQKTDTAGQVTEPAVFIMSEVFPGKTICQFCGMPVSPSSCVKPGVCVMCADKIEKVKDVMIVSQMHDGVKGRRGAFDEALSLLKQSAGPATAEIAEALLDKLGGRAELGSIIAQDIRRARGDDLPNEIKEIYEPDLKSLTRLYDIALRTISKRDDMVKEAEDPLDSLNPDDLMPLIAEAANLQIELDQEFRMKILRKIKEVAPEDFDQLWAEEAGLIPVPGVREV